MASVALHLGTNGSRVTALTMVVCGDTAMSDASDEEAEEVAAAEAADEAAAAEPAAEKEPVAEEEPDAEIPQRSGHAHLARCVCSRAGQPASS